MSEFIIFFLFFLALLSSVIGYGIFFQNIFFKTVKITDGTENIYIGFYGLFSITLVSIFTSLFLSHNYFHNLLIHLFGILFFIFLKIKKKKEYLKIILLISIFTFSALLISKTHDDFSYYHLPFTRYLTEHKVIFGMGNLLHGNKLISSLFFLNSTFYLPFINFFSFHFSILFFLIFFNFFLFIEILKKSQNLILRYLYLFAFLFFNLSFNRLAEFGTDKSGQILMVIIIIKIFEITCLTKNEINIRKFLLIFPLFIYCITLKTYFLSYVLVGFILVLFNQNLLKDLRFFFKSRVFLVSLFSIMIYFLHHFISTGCFISPISFTCFGNNLDWAQSPGVYKKLSTWLEQWAKAGAGPNFRVENPDEYIQNFNWLKRWFEFYFMEKMKDQLLLLSTTFLVIFFLFKKININSKKKLEMNKKILIFYLLIMIVFFIWFNYHPQLRYGGYTIIFLIISFPVSFLLQKFEDKNLFVRKYGLLVVFIMIVFNIKNIIRIDQEFKRTDLYRFKNFPFYSIPKKEYRFEKTDSGLIIYKTIGHCWDIPTPCIQSLNKFSLKTEKKNGYFFIMN